MAESESENEEHYEYALNTPLFQHSTDNSIKQSLTGIPCRAVFASLMFFGFVNVYALRVNLSVAMVAMVNVSTVDKNISSDDCPVDNPANTTITADGEFNWDNSLQGYILGSFFYGYILTQIPGGRAAELFGGKLLFGVGILCTSLLTLLTPLAARSSPYLLIALRVLEGMGEGVTFPAANALIAKWAPPLERTKICTFITAGAQFGTIIAMPVSGVICESCGWQWVFYLFGGLGCVWFLVYLFMVYDSPTAHPRITPAERTYIEKAQKAAPPDSTGPVPWRALLTSPPFWAVCVAHPCYNWGFYTLLTSMPKYLGEVLHFNISTNGFISALPYIFMYMSIVSGGQLADHLISKEVVSRTRLRKICTTIGMCGPAVSLLAVAWLGCDHVGAVAFLVLAGVFSGAVYSGYNVSHLDLAPPYAGTMLGITNTLATIPGFLGPEVVGWLTQGHATVGRWRVVFYLSAGVFVIGATVFAFLASGEVQPWAKPDLRQQRIQQVSDHPYADTSTEERS